MGRGVLAARLPRRLRYPGANWFHHLTRFLGRSRGSLNVHSKTDSGQEAQPTPRSESVAHRLPRSHHDQRQDQSPEVRPTSPVVSPCPIRIHRSLRLRSALMNPAAVSLGTARLMARADWKPSLLERSAIQKARLIGFTRSERGSGFAAKRCFPVSSIEGRIYQSIRTSRRWGVGASVIGSGKIERQSKTPHQ